MWVRVEVVAEEEAAAQFAAGAAAGREAGQAEAELAPAAERGTRPWRFPGWG